MAGESPWPSGVRSNSSAERDAKAGGQQHPKQPTGSCFSRPNAMAVDGAQCHHHQTQRNQGRQLGTWLSVVLGLANSC